MCRRASINQLTFKEVKVIKDYLFKPQYRQWSISSVYYQILRDRAAFFSKSTFYKYVNLMQLCRIPPEKRKYDIGIRAEAPKKVLHMDVTIYRPLNPFLKNHSQYWEWFLCFCNGISTAALITCIMLLCFGHH